MKFYLGTHKPHWLWTNTDNIPLFVSRRTLFVKKKFKPATTSWSLDSGGFSELSIHGKWTISAKQYCKEVQQCKKEIGKLDFAAIQDYMCEPFIIEKTGLSVKEHQKRTVENYVELMNLDNSLPWLPVIQGFTESEYFECIDLYQKYKIDLTNQIVGIGSVCRRQSEHEIYEICKKISDQNILLHGFGVKIKGLYKLKDILYSSDSLSWSYNARYKPPLPECNHRSCANCYLYAKKYYEKIQGILNV